MYKYMAYSILVYQFNFRKDKILEIWKTSLNSHGLKNLGFQSSCGCQWYISTENKMKTTASQKTQQIQIYLLSKVNQIHFTESQLWYLGVLCTENTILLFSTKENNCLIFNSKDIYMKHESSKFQDKSNKVKFDVSCY